MGIKSTVLMGIFLIVSTSANAVVIRTLNGTVYEWLEPAATIGLTRNEVEMRLSDPADPLYGYEYASRSLISDLFNSYAQWDGLSGYHSNVSEVTGAAKMIADFGATNQVQYPDVALVSTVDGDNVSFDSYTSLRGSYGSSDECGAPVTTCLGVTGTLSDAGVATAGQLDAAWGWDSAHPSPLTLSSNEANPDSGAWLVRVDSTVDYVKTTVNTLTDDTQLSYSPVLGQDSISKYVVYAAEPIPEPGSARLHILYIQRLNTDGSPQGPAMQISSGNTHDIHPDVSGKYIVYIAREGENTRDGKVIVFDLETGVATPIFDTSAAIASESKIYGDHIVWIQSTVTGSWIFYYNIAWLGSGVNPVVITGPSPDLRALEIGDRAVTWSQFIDGDALTYAQVMAYDYHYDTYNVVENDTSYNNLEPTTAGGWVFYQQQSFDGTTARIKGKNLFNGETRIIGEHSTISFQPSFDGEYVGYDAFVGDNTEVFVYRMSDGQYFQITDKPGHQMVNNVYGQDIAYLDTANSSTLSADYYRLVKVNHFEIIPANKRPVADAGADQAVHIGALVTLDGSASSDPDENYALSYSWSIASRPSGSTATLSDAKTVNPTFTADLQGDYSIELIVTDSLGLSGTADGVTVSTSNTAPVADAGMDQSLTTLGSVVTLDGSQSYDLESDPLTYAWSLLEKPVGSSAVLSDSSAEMPVFVADVQGAYIAELTVSDPWASSDADTVTISFNNILPVADAGGNQSVTVGDVVYLSGLASSDVNGDELSYQWGFASKPMDSLAVLSNDNSANASFVADVAGTYVLSLVVNDGIANSAPHNISVIATTTQTEIVGLINQVITNVNGLSTTDLKNKNMANALTNKLISVLSLIDQGLYQDALDKLNNDILKKTDGCVATDGPDKNDWIITCTGQAPVYDLIVDAIGLLEDIV